MTVPTWAIALLCGLAGYAVGHWHRRQIERARAAWNSFYRLMYGRTYEEMHRDR